MWFKKSKEIRELKERNKELLDYKELEIEILQKENKKLIENFTKNYHYVLTIDKNLRYIHLYQDGKEIKHVKSIEFEANISSLPTFNIEVN